ncbi:DUF4166 domain-containing protein [Streptomyces mirabilis]
MEERSDWMRRFHLGDDSVRGRGVVDVQRGERWTGRVVGRLLRLPVAQTRVPVRVDVLRDCVRLRRDRTGPRQACEERWIRQIGRRRLVSRQTRDADSVLERFGALELRMRLLVGSTELRWTSEGGVALYLGRHRLRMPAGLAPQVSASVRSEYGDGTGPPRFRLRVGIELPWTGLLLSYTGCIEEYLHG